MTTYVGGTGSLPVGTTPGEPPGRGAAFWIRTVLAAGAGTVATALLVLAVVLTVLALAVITPAHPGRSFVVLLSVPELRHDAADSLVADMEEERGAAFGPGTRDLLVEAADEVLGDPHVLDELADVRLVGGDLDPGAYLDVVGAALDQRARTTTDPDARRALTAFVESFPEVAVSSGGEGTDFAAGLADVRRYVLVAAAVTGALGLVALLVSVAIAVRRGIAAAAIASSSLLVTALALAPGDWLLGLGGGVPGGAARVVAAAGSFTDPGLVWSLLLASLVPPALWWAVRSLRRPGLDPRL